MNANRREFIIGAAVAMASSAAIRLLPSDCATAVELDRTYRRS